MAKWTILPSLGLLLPVIVGIFLAVAKFRYALPQPNASLYDPVTNLPTLSEAAILEYARQLSEDIGFRTVGTREHALADTWMLDVAHKLQHLCQQVAESGRKLECEVWRQEGSGSHRFDMMGKRVYKTYKNLSNIIMRISNGTPAGKEHAVLVNSHLDSTLPSPGAADDALPVGVMIETVRVLVETPDWEPEHAIIFLWNHAEESLQDGSHLYCTQHETAQTVRSVINLEAAGTTGPALLFQATSQEMIDAYSRVPRPFGTVLAYDIFASGIILSDTDFRQFEQYLNVTGLDLAIVGNSYAYHTQLDIVENIQPGSAQHMADQTLVLVKHLSSGESPLSTIGKRVRGVKPSTIYFSVLGRIFFSYSTATASALSLALFTSSVLLARAVIRDLSASHILNAAFAVLYAFGGSLLAVNFVAMFMQGVLNRPLSWFSNELAPVILYGPPALAGALMAQVVLPIPASTERCLLASVLVLHGLAATILQTVLRLGSSQIFFVTGLSQLAGLLYVYTLQSEQPGSGTRLSTYLVAELFPLILGCDLFCGIAAFFVPLTGRIGEDAPAEHIIATLVAVGGAISIPTIIPFFARFSATTTKRSVILLSLVTAACMGMFSLKSPFDASHPKRVFVLHTENVTSGMADLHISSADPAPGFEAMVQSVANNLALHQIMDVGGMTVEQGRIGIGNGDWDVLYPFSAFLTPYKLPLPSSPEPVASRSDLGFKIEATKDVTDNIKRIRKMELVVHHPGLVWSVIAFDAHVLSWSLDENPPPEYSRHWIKEASFYGVTQYDLSLQVQIPDDVPLDRPILFNFIGVKEDTMYPGKISDAKNASLTGELGGSMALLEHLNSFLHNYTRDSVDVLLLGCLAGALRV